MLWIDFSKNVKKKKKKIAQNGLESMPIIPMSCFGVIFPTLKKQFSNNLTAVFSELRVNLTQVIHKNVKRICLNWAGSIPI